MTSNSKEFDYNQFYNFKDTILKIPIDKAVEGMVLSSAVISDEGHVLANAGLELSKNDINWFRSVGVNVIEIERITKDEEKKKEEHPYIQKLKKMYNATTLQNLKIKIVADFERQFDPCDTPLREELKKCGMKYFLTRNKM